MVRVGLVEVKAEGPCQAVQDSFLGGREEEVVIFNLRSGDTDVCVDLEHVRLSQDLVPAQLRSRMPGKSHRGRWHLRPRAWGYVVELDVIPLRRVICD